MSAPGKQDSSGRLVRRLVLVVIAMFGFGYLLVPLYNVFCEITGANGKTGQLDGRQAAKFQVDEDRTVIVEFDTTLNQYLDWEFRPNVRRMEVHPGKLYQTSYFARNNTDSPMIGQAVPSLAPSEAATYFSKTECFCFSNQKFEAGEARDMPLTFVIDPALPEYVKRVTLSYTFFDVTKTAKK